MYPINFPLQLAAYLRSLRKAKGLTQAQLGAMLGVSRARVSEIEKDPSNVGFNQLLRILHLLDAKLEIETRRDVGTPPRPPRVGTRGEW